MDEQEEHDNNMAVADAEPQMTTVIEGDLERRKVAEVFGEQEYSKYSRELDKIIEWAKSQGAKDMNSILWEVRYLSNRIGSPIGGNKLKYMYQYVYLLGERGNIDKELHKFETLKDGTI